MKAGYIFSFIAGAAIGVVAGFKLSETKYQAKIQEEIASVKEAFRNRKVDISKFAPKESKKVDDFLDEVSKKVFKKPEQEVRKVPYSTMYKAPSKQSEEERVIVETKIGEAKKGPYVISPDEFGEDQEYEQISLIYYADNTLADDEDMVMDEEEIERTVGMDSLTRFGEYEPDSVFVRNDELKTEYEILLDQRPYFEVLKEKPYLRRDDE